MPESAINQPLVFQPLFMERIWGGRRLEALFGKRLPPGLSIGESWELVDRPEAQSVVDGGAWRGRTLHDIWETSRREVFGDIADAPRFPLLIKLLDASDKLSVQVHPPPAAAAELGGEPKTEFWYIADALPASELYVGVKPETSRAAFEAAIADGRADEHLHRIPVKRGDAMFLPSGRVHAIGAGNVIVEIQQNSDTTYRVFDWHRVDRDGTRRELHVSESLRCIDFADCEPSLVEAEGESLVRHELFHVENWNLDAAREGAPAGEFAVICCVCGELACGDVTLRAGELALLPASLQDRTLHPTAADTSVLRVTMPAA
jgi:mannose-6-phosphate isomerase